MSLLWWCMAVGGFGFIFSCSFFWFLFSAHPTSSATFAGRKPGFCMIILVALIKRELIPTARRTQTCLERYMPMNWCWVRVRVYASCTQKTHGHMQSISVVGAFPAAACCYWIPHAIHCGTTVYAESHTCMKTDMSLISQHTPQHRMAPRLKPAVTVCMHAYMRGVRGA